MNRHELEAAAAEFSYHRERLTELSADVGNLADSAADAARALLAMAHMLSEGRGVKDAARLLSMVLGSPWTEERIAATFIEATALEGRRDTLARLVEAQHIAAGR